MKKKKLSSKRVVGDIRKSSVMPCTVKSALSLQFLCASEHTKHFLFELGDEGKNKRGKNREPKKE